MFPTLTRLWLLLITALFTTITLAAPLTYRGADVSMLSEVERHGGKLLEQGKEVDAFTLLKAHHFNLIRLRLWVAPRSFEGAPYGGGSTGWAGSGHRLLATLLALVNCQGATQPALGVFDTQSK